jgi:uncharacterized protein YigE (DUF2233 family)
MVGYHRGAHAVIATIVVALALINVAPTAQAAECRSESYEGMRYAVCSVDVTETDLRIFWRNNERKPYRTFAALADDLAERGSELVFAMNGGMYGVDLRPIGLLIEEGNIKRRANMADAPAGVRPVPNFYKKPNGVFYIGDAQAGVMETGQFLKTDPPARFATQSGPLLVIDGVLHDAFIEGSSDRRLRNGVGVSSPTEVHFAISMGPVNFHDFARFFRDHLGADSALYLDGGSAPGLYSLHLQRNDRPGHGGYGPIIGAVRKMPPVDD